MIQPITKREARQWRRIGIWALLLAILGAALWATPRWIRRNPEHLPWTRLELTQPVGLFTGRKLAALTSDFPACRAALDRAHIRYTTLPVVSASGGQCGYRDGIRLATGGPRTIGFSPARLGTACPVAAALVMWEREVVAPAARRHFGKQVTRIDHLGSYNCRRMYGRGTGAFSEHATADAVDVAGFRLSDGTEIRIVRDWQGGGAKAAFLREVSAGACDLFATVLGPEYNAAHRDHFHLDQASRATGWRVCR